MQKNYLKIFESLSLPVLVLEPRPDGFVVVNANKKYVEVIGRKKEELNGFLIPDLFPENPEQPDQSQKDLLNSFKTVLKSRKKHFLGLIRYDVQNSSTGKFEEKYWEVENIPVFDDEGKSIELIVNTAKDKTQEVLKQKRLKKLEEDLKHTTEQQKHFIESNPDGLYSLDVNGKFLNVNAGLLQITETSEENLLKMDFLPFCVPHHKELILSYFRKALEGDPQKFEADFISANGREMVLSISIVPMIFNDEITGVYGIARDITESKKNEDLILQKENELQKRENKYRALVQEAFDLVGILELNGNYKFVSESSASVLGIPPEDFIGKNAFDFIHPEDKDRVLKDFSEVNTQKKIKIAPFRFIDGEGNWRWVETNVTNMIHDPNVGGVVTNSREVTDLMKMNCEIKQLYERYSLAAAATGDLIYDWDLETDVVIRFFSGKEKQFGYEREEIDQRRFWREHVHPEELESLRKLLRSTLSNPQRNQIRTTYRFRRADGSYAHLIDRGMIVRDESGRAVRVIGATSDISGLVNRRNALRLANKRFTYAMKATQEMIWDWDIANNIIDRGKAFKKVFGYNDKEKPSVQEFWFSCIVESDRDRVRESLEKSMKDPSLNKWRQEYKIRKPNGEKAYVIDRGFIIRDQRGKAVRMIGATLDVTDSRRMLKEIKKQNKILKEVAWEQAHVVRAPIARLKGLLNLFDEDYNGEWEKEEILQLIKDSTEELDRVVVNIIRKTEGVEVDG